MPDETPRRDRALGKTACIFVGGILLFASYSKLLEPGGFVEQIHLEGLDFWLSATSIAVVAIFLETCLGILLLLGVTNRVVLAGTALLALFFLYLTGQNYWLVSQGLRDPEAACGCFGDLIQRTAAQAFWQDLLMLGLPLIVAIRMLPRSFHFPPYRSMVAAVVSILVALFMARSPSLVAAGDALHYAAEGAREGARETVLVPMSARVFVDDEEDFKAQVFLSEGSASFVIVSTGLPNLVVLDPRQQSFKAVGRENLQANPAGGRRLAEASQPVAEGNFEMAPDGIRLSVDGKAVRLIPD